MAASGGSLPWASLGRAVWGSTDRSSPNTSEAAAAGDVVLIASGTYSGPRSADRFTPTFNPANSGTSGNVIEFRADGTVTLQTTGATSGGPTIGAAGRDYIQWTGPFYIDEANALSTPDTGVIVVNDAAFVTIDGATIVGRGNIARGDNYPGIRLEDVMDVTIRNCEVSEFKGEGGTNSPAIQLYGAGRILVEHCYLHDCDGGVTLKASFEAPTIDDITIRYNLMDDLTNGGIEVHRSGTAEVYVYQNIVTDAGEGLTIKQWDADTTTGPRTVYCINNTFVNNTLGGYKIKGDPNASVTMGCETKNNIIQRTSSGGAGVYFEDVTTGAPTSDYLFDRNLYSVTDWSLATFQGSYSGQDVNSDEDDPLFTNAGAGDYTLQGGSPALTLGRVVHSIGGTNGATIPAGAYITGSETIGLE